MSQNNRLFTIGQFAALHRINKKTLMWYDQIGLFTPAVVKGNGYRYYTYQQCFVLETILMLRELNVSIPEIQQFMAHRTTDSFQAILQEKNRQIQDTIAHLNQVQEALQHQMEGLSSLKNLDLYGYSLVEKPAQRLILRKHPSTFPQEQGPEPQSPQAGRTGAYRVYGILPAHLFPRYSRSCQSAPLSRAAFLRIPPLASTREPAGGHLVSEVGRHGAYRIYGMPYGGSRPTESLYRQALTDDRGIFLQIPHAEIEANVHIQPAGLYLRTHFKGSWEGLPGKYREIMAYAQEQGLEFTGYSYETGINDVISNAPEDYITRIEIPIQEKEKRP